MIRKDNLLQQKEYLGPTRVPVLLSYVPDGRPKPLVLLAPGGGNQGIDNCKELMAQTLPLEDEDLFRVYVDLPLHGERAAPDLGKRFHTDQVGLFLHPVVVGMAREFIQLIDILAERPDVDSERVGVGGWSLGGQASLIAAAADRRIRTVVAMCIPCDADMGPRARVPDDPAHDVLKTELDVVAVADFLSHAAVLLIHGTKDAWVTVESSRILNRALRPYYATYPERLRLVEYPNMAHSISKPEGEDCAREQLLLKEEVAGWFRRFLHED
ncbi:MAG: prolyl oligopeptidase family serine peptidase [Dehalococcoidia bacterium]|nr:prolyl oligopeptidase family serine peptidase [Dehalococcoidia bacterium]